MNNKDKAQGSFNMRKNLKYFLIFPILASLVLLARNLDNDIWFLLTHGRYVMEHGFPMIEPFTIHEGFKFVMQQWLSAAIFYITYSNFGEIGLKLLVMISYIFGLGIFYKLCMRVSRNQINSILVSYLYVILVISFMTTRPFIFTSLVMMMELIVLEAYFHNNNKRVLLALPLLSLMLINLQAAMWPMLFVIFLPFAVDAFKFKIGSFQSPGVRKKPLLFAVISMILVGFANPYGLDAMLYIRNSYGVEAINQLIIEMSPAKADSILGLLTILVVTGISYVYMHSYRKVSIRHILLAVGTGYLSLITIRGILIFTCCGLYPLAMLINTDRIPQFDQKNPTRTLRIRKVLLLLIAIMSLVTYYKIQTESQGVVKDEELFVRLLDMAIQDSRGEPIVLYTGYNDGGLAEFHGVASYIDPRAEVFLKKNNLVDDVFMEYYMLQKGLIYYQDVLNKYHFSHLIVTKDDLLHIYLSKDEEYSLLGSNDSYTLYKRIK